MKNKIFSVIGARPHFIKAAPFMEAMKISNHKVYTIHTGQHYDKNMSDVFFSELGLPKPDINLGIGSGSHAKQTGAVMIHLESLIKKLKPIAVVVYGDTNSTLGAALAASKLYVPVVHVEAGVRCGNNKMPEEINRRIIDHISEYLICPSKLAVQNLKKEGLKKNIFNIGDFMYDTFLKAKKKTKKKNFNFSKFNIVPGKYYLSTLHREETTLSVKILSNVLDTLGSLDLPTILPLHPRSLNCLKQAGISINRKDKLKIIEPVSYLQMINLLKNSSMVLTDSGGLQKEAYWSKIPCVTLMNETTWTETVNTGWNKITGLNSIKIVSAINYLKKKKIENYKNLPEIYGPPGAAIRMVKKLGWV